MRPVNKDIQAGDWVFVDGHARTNYKLGTRAAGPYKVLARGEGTFSLDIGGYTETVSSDHVTAAPGPPGDPRTLLQNLGVPQDVVVPEGHQHTGKEFVWEAFVWHEVADVGTLPLWTRWWGYHPEEDTLELASRFDLRKVHQYMRRVGLRVEEAGSVVDFLAKGIPARGGHVVFVFRIVAGFGQRHVLRWGPQGRGGDHPCRAAGWWPSPCPWTRAKSIGHRGRVRNGGLVKAASHGPVGRRITRWDRDSVRGTRGALVRDTQMTYAGFTGR